MNFRIALLSALLLPATALAATTQEWVFSGKVNTQGWQNQGLDRAAGTLQGVEIRSSIDGQFRIDIQPGAYQALTIGYQSLRNQETIFLWEDAIKPGEAHGVPVRLPASPLPTEVQVDLQTVDTWNPNTSRIGLQFGAGADVILTHVTLHRWNAAEKLWYGFISLWNFDYARAYTINFLWGPILAWNPIAMQETFFNIPPQGRSWNWVFYGVLAVVLVLSMYLSHGESASLKRTWMKRFFLVFAFCFVLYDIRMTLELGSYLQYDYDTFHSKDFADQQFRDRGFFIQFADAIGPVVAEEQEYVFLPFQGYPYMGELRYLTYPSIPVTPEGKAADTTLWVIFNRPEIQLNEAGALVANGEVLSPPGTVTHEFAPGTFLFRTQ